MLRFIVFILLISPSLVFGQKSTYRAKIKDALFFWDDMHQKFVVIDDSVSIHVFNNGTKNWDSEPLLLSSEITFNNLISDFIPVSRAHKSTLFVHSGGGIVLELKGNKIERIDHSFAHKNQYFGTFFSYKNEPYIFGGYGLFSFKDFITRFDYNEKEWFKSIIKKTKPKPRRLNISIIEENKLYVFGGEGEYDEKYTFLNDAWVLDFNNMRWAKLGLLNNRIPNSIPEEERSSLSLSFDAQHYFVTNESIYRFFPNKNKVRIYTNQIHSKVRNIVEKGSHFLIKCRKQFSNEVDFVVVDSKDFFRDLVAEETYIFTKENTNSKLIAITMSIILIFILVLLSYVFQKNKKTNKKEIKTLDTSEVNFLKLVLRNANSGVSLVEINDLLNFGNPSYDTLKKRREIFLKNLKYKLEMISTIPADEILIEIKNEEDKRMKSIQINQELFLRLDEIIMNNNS